MKKTLFLFFVLFSYFNMNAQDIVVKNSGDSVRCKITSMDSTKIYLILKKNGNEYNSYINKNEVKAYYYNAYDATIKIRSASDWKKWKVRLNINIGPGYQMSGEPFPPLMGDLTTYDEKIFDNLRLGKGFGGDLEVYYKFIGIGVKYNFFQARTNIDATTRELYRYQYIGPSICLMGIMLNKTSIAHFAVTGGKLYFEHNKNFVVDSTYGKPVDVVIKANTFAFGATAGFDFLLDETFSLGIESTILYGQFKTYKLIIPAPVGITQNMTGLKYNAIRVDLNIGMKFYF